VAQQGCLHTGLLLRSTATNRNYELYKNHSFLIDFYSTWRNNLKLVKCRNSIFLYLNYYFYVHFAAPWTLLPESGRTTCPPPRPLATPKLVCGLILLLTAVPYRSTYLGPKLIPRISYTCHFSDNYQAC